MTNTQKTLQELNNIIDFLKTKVDTTTTFTGTEKADYEKRINDLRTNDNDKELSINGVQNQGNILLAEKAELLAKKDDAEAAKTQAETNLAKKEEEVGKKLTPELITKLEKLANKNLELKRVPKLKADGTEEKDPNGNTIYEELIDLSELKTTLKEINEKKVDLTATNTKLEEVKEIAKNHSTPAWVGYAGLVGGLCSFALVFYNTFLKPNNKQEND